MTILSPEIENKLRRGFHYFNHGMVFMWRLGLGFWMNDRRLSGRIMVITHIGRKSGVRRRTPVNFTVDNGDIYCTAGFGAGTDWYRNILSNPQVEVWLPDGWWGGVAEDATGCQDHLRLMRQVLIASGFAAYAAGIDPVKLSDEELIQITEPYRLVRIRRTTPMTGSGGPGDLSWIWQVATFILLPLALFGRRRKS